MNAYKVTFCRGAEVGHVWAGRAMDELDAFLEARKSLDRAGLALAAVPAGRNWCMDERYHIKIERL